ncbi:MAG: cation transporter [Deltaproteobacteria bacterium]|nr:cation transporter [Deltaproteobacteria bacterium]
MKYSECERCGKWSPRMSLVGNILAVLFKVSVGMLTGSKGLVADGVHSIADSVASSIILVSLYVAKKPQDRKHPYGLGKVEYLSTLVTSVFLFCAASLILVEVLKDLFYGVHLIPDKAAIPATLVCLIYSYIMYRSNICAGTQLGSPALVADANESKADSISSVAVLIGLIGTHLGFIYADALAAGFVSVLIYRMSAKMFLQGIHGLIDFSADREIIDQIQKLALAVAGVKGVRTINTRVQGQKNWIDMVIEVLGDQSILETHRISEQVKEKVRENIKEIDGMTVSFFPVKKRMFGIY